MRPTLSFETSGSADPNIPPSPFLTHPRSTPQPGGRRAPNWVVGFTEYPPAHSEPDSRGKGFPSGLIPPPPSRGE